MKIVEIKKSKTVTFADQPVKVGAVASPKTVEETADDGGAGGGDEEAVRVIAKAKKWSPGKQRGRPVKVRMILPITFKLG